MSNRGIDELRAYLDNFWSEALAAYGAEIVRRKARRASDAANSGEQSA